jgi:hypothetical protein
MRGGGVSGGRNDRAVEIARFCAWFAATAWKYTWRICLVVITQNAGVPLHVCLFVVNGGVRYVYFADKERDLLETLPALSVLFPSNFHPTTPHRSSANICSSGRGAQEKWKEGMKLSLPAAKLVEKTSLGSQLLFRFYKISFPVTHLMPYYDKTDCSRHLIA